MGEAQKHAKWKKAVTEYYIWLLLHLYELFRLGKSTESESRLALAQSWEVWVEGLGEWRKCGVIADGYRVSFGDDENILKLWWQLHNSEYTKNH